MGSLVFYKRIANTVHAHKFLKNDVVMMRLSHGNRKKNVTFTHPFQVGSKGSMFSSGSSKKNNYIPLKAGFAQGLDSSAAKF